MILPAHSPGLCRTDPKQGTVRVVGIEPTRGYPHRLPEAARLPVTPHPQGEAPARAVGRGRVGLTAFGCVVELRLWVPVADECTAGGRPSDDRHLDLLPCCARLPGRAKDKLGASCYRRPRPPSLGRRRSQTSASSCSAISSSRDELLVPLIAVQDHPHRAPVDPGQIRDLPGRHPAGRVGAQHLQHRIKMALFWATFAGSHSICQRLQLQSHLPDLSLKRDDLLS
jgi:hypothetical protein